MKKLLGLIILASLAACGENTNSDTETSDSIQMENPAEVQPPADAIPDSMRIINDSVIQPDPSGTGTTTQGTKHDSL